MKKLRSRVTTDGLDRAPHRAFMRAMGLDDQPPGMFFEDLPDGAAKRPRPRRSGRPADQGDGAR